MKVLLVSNFSQPRCGIANYGEQVLRALRRLTSVQVTPWDGRYQAIQDRGGKYLPDDLEAYDVVYFNWHPITINHYVPEHFAWVLHGGHKPLLSLFLQDLPPWSSCPFEDYAHVLFAAEPGYKAAIVLPYPIVDYVPLRETPGAATPPTWWDPRRVVIGYSGVRGDGMLALRAICEQRGWVFNCSDPERWLSTEEEIERLSWSTLNACWYTEKRGRASAPMTCLASRRPLLLGPSDCTMFDDLRQYGDEIYFAPAGMTLETALGTTLETTLLNRPNRVLAERSWLRAALRMHDAWQAAGA